MKCEVIKENFMLKKTRKIGEIIEIEQCDYHRYKDYLEPIEDTTKSSHAVLDTASPEETLKRVQGDNKKIKETINNNKEKL